MFAENRSFFDVLHGKHCPIQDKTVSVVPNVQWKYANMNRCGFQF